MQIEEAIATHLLAQTDLTSLIGGRFYFDELPQQDTFPAIVAINISDIKEHALDGMLTLEHPIFQFMCIAKTKSSSKSVAEKLKSSLTDLGDFAVQKIELLTELAIKDKEIGLYIVHLEYKFYFLRS